MDRAWARLCAMVGQGRTVLAACALAGVDPAYLDNATHPQLQALAQAKVRAAAREEAQWLAMAAAGGQNGIKAQEEIDARRRIDWAPPDLSGADDPLAALTPELLAQATPAQAAILRAAAAARADAAKVARDLLALQAAQTAQTALH